MNSQASLKNDLIALDAQAFYLKYIVKSRNWYFSEYLKTPLDDLIDKMDFFKEIVSSGFHISFHCPLIVGSAKTGFSLSPKKILNPFHGEDERGNSSDIDIAIVSDQLFSTFWYKLRESGRSNRKVYYTRLYQEIASSVFKGFINDHSLNCINGLQEEWTAIVDPINIQLQDKLRFEHPITYRIYRSWEDLEEYQIEGIKKAKHQLEVQ